MAGLQRAGRGSAVVVNGTHLNMAEWRANGRGDDLDTTNFESGGAETGLIGVQVIEWDMGGDWDAINNFYDEPPGIYPRDDFGTLRLYQSFADGINWILNLNRVLSAENSTQVRGKVSFRASGKSNGNINFFPSGSVVL